MTAKFFLKLSNNILDHLCLLHCVCCLQSYYKNKLKNTIIKLIFDYQF